MRLVAKNTPTIGRTNDTASPIAKARIINSRCTATLPRRIATNALPNANRNSVANSMVAAVSFAPPIAI